MTATEAASDLQGHCRLLMSLPGRWFFCLAQHGSGDGLSCATKYGGCVVARDKMAGTESPLHYACIMSIPANVLLLFPFLLSERPN